MPGSALTDHDLPLGLSVTISHSAADEKREAWEAKALALFPSAHLKRRTEWASARVALEIAFSAQGVSLNPQQTRFLTHQSIEGLPEWKFSLSHNEAGAVAWVVPANAAAMIGVDLESSDRPISAAVADRFRAEGDASLAPIQLWGIKEAAYKSLPEKTQKALWLNGITILSHGVFRADIYRGQWIQKSTANSILSYAWCAWAVSASTG